MKKLGMVGGIGWQSTIDYYKAICRLSLVHHSAGAGGRPPPMPEMTIESLDIGKSYGLRGGSNRNDVSWVRYDQYFRSALQRIEDSGADVAIIASNTPHNRYSYITAGIRIPVLSIFDAVARHCARLDIAEMLVLGTAPTMDGPEFADVLARQGIVAHAPASRAARESIVALISELYAGRGEAAAARIRRVVDESVPRGAATRVVCLACGELPLAFPQIEGETDMVLDGIRYLNTTMIHAQAAFDALLDDGDAAAPPLLQDRHRIHALD
jgi:aspartate racemase